MAKEYIGSQEHFEDEVNAYYDQLEELNRQQLQDMYNQQCRDMEQDILNELEPKERATP